MDKILITGGCGFIGTNLTSVLLDRGAHVAVIDNLSRVGAANNLAYLRSKGLINFKHTDIRSREDIDRLVYEFKPDVVFHLAGQVAMTTSLLSPVTDFEINALGTVYLLDSLKKHSPRATVIYSSTNKVYGDLEYLNYRTCGKRYTCIEYPSGFNEEIKLDLSSPYGCSKGAADQYVLDYSRHSDLSTCVFRHSTVYGVQQWPTYDQGWVGWFILEALEKKAGKDQPFTISGSGLQVRDVLYCTDVAYAYLMAAEKKNDIRGKAYNIGGGIDNSLSLLELFDYLENILDIKLNFTRGAERKADQKFFVARADRATQDFGWAPSTKMGIGLDAAIEWNLRGKKVGGNFSQV